MDDRAGPEAVRGGLFVVVSRVKDQSLSRENAGRETRITGFQRAYLYKPTISEYGVE